MEKYSKVIEFSNLNEHNKPPIEQNKIKEQMKKDITNVTINSQTRMKIFISMVCISLFTNLDGGIIPRATDQIKMDINIGETEIGYYGSIDYLGRLVGSLIYIIIITKTNRLFLLQATLIMKGISLIIPFIYSGENFTLLYFIIMICRFLSGLSQVYYTIYLPVWCDQYGAKKHNILMIMFIQLGLPAGIVLGYGMSMVLQENWKLCFLIEGIICVCLAVFYCSFPLIYFSNDLILVEGTNNKLKRNPNIKESNILLNLKDILSNKIFLLTGLSNSVVFFGMGVVQYWVDSYMLNVMNIESGYRFIIFCLVCVTGPPMGVIVGGVLGSYIGGYHNKKAIVLCVYFSLFSCILAMIIGFCSNAIVFTVLMWLYICLISAMTPLETGIIINALPEELRGDGFSVMNFILNMLGNLPASSIYGIIYEKTKDKYSNMAMVITMSYNILGFVFILIGLIYRFKK